MSHDAAGKRPPFEGTEQRLEAIVGRVVGEGVPVRSQVVFGDPVEEIQIVASKEACDLIVITVKNRSKVGKLVMGSLAQDILLTVDQPVLCVRPD